MFALITLLFRMLPRVRSSKPKHWGEENAPCTTTKMRRRKRKKKKKKKKRIAFDDIVNNLTSEQRVCISDLLKSSRNCQRLLHKKCDCPFLRPQSVPVYYVFHLYVSVLLPEIFWGLWATLARITRCVGICRAVTARATSKCTWTRILIYTYI